MIFQLFMCLKSIELLGILSKFRKNECNMTQITLQKADPWGTISAKQMSMKCRGISLQIDNYHTFLTDTWLFAHSQKAMISIISKLTDIEFSILVTDAYACNILKWINYLAFISNKNLFFNMQTYMARFPGWYKHFLLLLHGSFPK